MNPIVVAHLFSCFFMTGLIWVIQIVHYPTFHFVDKSQFQVFEKFHSARISLIVIPIMLLELFTGIFLLMKSPGTFFILNSFGLVLIWISTFFLSVPLHGKLLKNSDQGLSKSLTENLIFTNWPRTILWTLRSVLWGYFLIFPSFV